MAVISQCTSVHNTFFFIAISHLLTVVFRGEKIHLYGGETSLSRIKTDLGLELKIILSGGVELKSKKTAGIDPFQIVCLDRKKTV